MTKDKIYINGEWVASTGTGQLPVTNSTTEEVIAYVPNGSADDVDRAVKAAAHAFTSWSQTSLEERIKYCQAIADGLKARQADLANLIAQEVGMPLKLTAMIQVGAPIFTFGATAEAARTFAFEEQLGSSLVIKEPVGVVACITPWNYPLHQIAAKVAPALIAGCTIVLKPSEIAPLNAYALTEVIHEVGLPAGVFNLISGTATPVGEALVSHPLVDMISFTGSTRAGKRISELAAQQVKRVTLELGGKSPNVILDDADLQKAVSDGVGKCYLNSGQTCSALTRMLVPRERLAEAEAIAAKTAAKFVPGDPFKPETRLGPLVSQAQRERVRNYIQKGLDEGAKLITGGLEAPAGLDKGYFVQPTIFSEVESSMTIAQEEIFGPVLVIMPYDNEDDAIRIANDTVYGLAGGVWSGDPERAKRVARRLRTGQIEINGGAFNPLAPFGGFKQSGHGREYGSYGLEEFLEIKSLQL